MISGSRRRDARQSTEIFIRGARLLFDQAVFSLQGPGVEVVYHSLCWVDAGAHGVCGGRSNVASSLPSVVLSASAVTPGSELDDPFTNPKATFHTSATSVRPRT